MEPEIQETWKTYETNKFLLLACNLLWQVQMQVQVQINYKMM